MLLKRLVDYARADPNTPPPFYGSKNLRWAVELTADGEPATKQPTPLVDPSKPATRNGRVDDVPAVQRSGTAPQPMLAVDTAEYVLGWPRDDTYAAKADRYHTAFRELIAKWQATDPNPAASAVLRFLQSNGQARLERPSELAGTDLVAFRVVGEVAREFAHQTESARRFWAAEAARRKGSERIGLCLVCGQVGRLLQTIPQQLPTRLVPGATNSASLISMNKAAHGFDLQVQLVHTPICPTCGLQAITALEALLSGQSTSDTLPGQDARLAWWVTEDASFDYEVLDEPTPERVAELLGSAAKGQASNTPDLSMFCALVVGGNVARVVVREWIERPLDDIVGHLEQWFADHQIADAWTGEPVYVPLRRLATVSGRWIPGRGGRGAYARFGASGADRPEGLYHALLKTALLGTPLPPKLLAHLIQRIRSDGRVDTERTALLRLALRRRPGVLNPESYMPTLNPQNHQPAYLAGRLFAVLQDLQEYTAWVRKEQLNVTFTDRYFARAITSPAVALVAGRKDARAWLKRLRRDRPVMADRYDQQLADLFKQLDDTGGVPHGAVLAEQAAFILGYSQQRATARAERTAGSPKTNSDASEPELTPEGASA